MQNEINYNGIRIIEKNFAEAQAKLREHAETHEWWIVLFDAGGMALVEEITQRHYWTADSKDVFCCLVPAKGAFLGVALFRRSLMLAPKYRWILAKHNVVLSAAEVAESGAILRVYDHNASVARGFASSLGMAVRGDDLAINT